MKLFTDRNKKDAEDFLEYCSKRIYNKISDTSFECFFTKERLSLEEALKKNTELISSGTEWGLKWEYGWFFTQIKIPEGYDNQRIVFKASLGECVAFVNGQVYGALDKEHKEITLTTSAKAGDTYDIALEVYAGHGPLYTTRTVLPSEDCEEFADDILQNKVTNGEFGVFSDEVFSLLMDVKVLYNLMQSIDENTMRYKMIAKGLKEVFTVIDIEAPDDEFFVQSEKAREILKPLLLCKNGTSTPVAYSVGHSHLDLEWLWPVNETRRKAARTIGNQLRLINEYPEYKYVQSQPWILETIKNEYPRMYSEITEAVKNGQIIPEGGTWVEMDTNIPSGESLVRQFIFGKEFIKNEFERDSKILWLPDVFGLSAALPQIMKGCDMDYIYNAKMSWSYANNIPLYKGTFFWRGVDGTEVIINNNESYAAAMTPEQNIATWKNADNTENIPDVLVTFGHGDGGGGATREHIELAKRQKNLEGVPKIKITDPLEFYKNVEENYNIDKVFEGEFWFAEHKGTYTTQAKTKRFNRKCEQALHEAEFWSTLLENNKKQELDELWKDLLFNQFHDIIPGTAIAATYERAEKSYKNILQKAETITDEVVSCVLDKNDDAMTVFNSLPWERWAEIELPQGVSAVENSKKDKFYAYKSGDRVCVSVLCDGCSTESFTLLREGEPECDTTASELVLENDFLRAEFNSCGELISLKNENAQEYISAPSNKFRIYKNHPNSFDAWDIDIDYPQKEVLTRDSTTAEIISKTKEKTVLRITKEILNSKIEQDVILRRNSKRLDFETTISWQETHKMLKVDFDTNIHTSELVSEIQFGHIKRPNHTNFDQDIAQYEKFQHKWSALFETGRGFAILNDCKYGISAMGGRASLTLLTSSMAPMIDADKGVHKFTYSVCVTDNSLDKSHIVREAYSLNFPVIVKNGYCEKKTFFTVSDKNIVIETVKAAEDGSGDIIVRLYDSANRASCFTLDCGFSVKTAYITNMLEANLRSVEVNGSAIDLSIKALEVLTLRLKRQGE